MQAAGQPPSSGQQPQAQPPKAPAPQAPPTAQKPPAAQGTTRTKELADALKERFSDATVDYVREKRLKLTVSPPRIKEVAFFVRDELRFDHISCVSGTDYIAKNEIEIIYFVGSLSRPGYEDVIIALAERPKRDNPVVQSLVEVWLGAEYHERETYEMLGVNFQGHPDLRFLLLPEDWNDLPPLRKDYNSPGR
jgi:NADH:ubiquinone oxidoreductase subunit C